ncbi:hypothetical protein DSO57_1034523 [Entomophthora muscae]|uniref:Uncharacterized protein n=1 Tax=Entomophthora muscae TaxID=34485 RepID=A0ACC2S1Z8_9FUNG|nr:hypothetical protein DSO57_1034523 [Entomophthora muscae]
MFNPFQQCLTLVCPGLLLTGNYSYKTQLLHYQPNHTLAINTLALHGIFDTVLHNKPLPLLKIYKFSRESLKDNPPLLSGLQMIHFNGSSLGKGFAEILWFFFKQPRMPLSESDPDYDLDQDPDSDSESGPPIIPPEEKLLSTFLKHTLDQALASPTALHSTHSFIKSISILFPNLISHFEALTTSLFDTSPDIKDQIRKLLVSASHDLIRLKQLNAEFKSDIEKFLTPFPTITQALSQTFSRLQSKYKLIPSELLAGLIGS